MTIAHGHRHGFNHGHRHGAADGGGAVGGPVATDFNFFSPEPQSFPASVAEVTALGWSSNVLAGWGFQEAGGTTFADFSGNGRTLTKNGAATKVFLGQRFVGAFDGASFREQRCYECVPGGIATDRFEVSSTATLNDLTTPKHFLIVFRAPMVPSATTALFGKAGGSGYYSLNFNTFGYAVFTVFDGVTAVSAAVSLNHCDGGLHYALVTVDPTGADTIRVQTDLASGAAVSTAAINWNNVPGAATQVFSIGGQTAAHNPTACQIRLLLAFDDISTPFSAVQAWWQHGRVPSWLTYSRASSFHAPVADDSTGDVVACWGTGQIAFEYDSQISTNPLKLGMAADLAGTNLILNSNLDNANWVGTGTVSHFDLDGPRGFRDGTRHTKTAINQSILCSLANGAAVTAASVYTASVWVRWDGLVTAPVLQVYRADGTTSIGSVSATDGTNKWRRISYTFTAPATESVRLALKASADASATGTAYFFGPMVNTDDYAKPYVHTSGGTASTTTITAYVKVPGLLGSAGTIKAWFTMRDNTMPAGRRYVFAARVDDGSNDDGLVAYMSETVPSKPDAQMYQDGGVLLAASSGASPGDLTTFENVMVVHWDAIERSGWSVRSVSNTAAPGTAVADIVAAPLRLERLYAGSASAGSALGGIVSKIRVYRYPELAA